MNIYHIYVSMYMLQTYDIQNLKLSFYKNFYSEVEI